MTSLPERYTRLFDYSFYQNANPTRPLPGVQVNIDFDDLKRVTDDLIAVLEQFVLDGELELSDEIDFTSKTIYGGTFLSPIITGDPTVNGDEFSSIAFLDVANVGVPLYAAGVPAFTGISGTGVFARVNAPVFTTGFGISNSQADGAQTAANSGILLGKSGWAQAAIYPIGVAGFAGALAFATAPADAPSFIPIERARIDKDGQLGLGTTTPLAQLHTTGTVRHAAMGGSGTGVVVVDNDGDLAFATVEPGNELVLTPEMFGVTDPTNTTQCEAALDSMAAAIVTAGGGRILLNKMYHKDAIWTLTNVNNVIIESTDGGGLYHPSVVSGTEKHLISLAHCDNVVIRGLSLLGHSSATRPDAQFAIMVLDVDRLRIHDNYFQYTLCAVWMFNSRDFQIYGNTIRNMLADGIHVENGCVDGTIFSNFLDGCGDDAIALLTEDRDVTVDFPTNVRVLKVDVIANKVNRTRASGSGIRLTGVDFCSVSDNIVNGTPQTGIGLFPGAAGIAESSNCKVSRNQIIAYNGYAVDPIYYNHPTPTPPAACGIGIFWATRCEIDNNHIYEGTSALGFGRGIEMNSSCAGNNVHDNDIGQTSYGINMADNNTLGMVSIANNTVMNNRMHTLWGLIGISVNKSVGYSFNGNIIKDNVIRQTGLTAGVYVYGTGADVLLVKDNICHGSTVTGSGGGAGGTVFDGNVTM